MTEEALRWNRFIDEVCYKDISELSDIQKKAVLCFWYDAEMGSGGHSGYFDNCPEDDPDEVYEALLEIGNKEIADNYRKALTAEAEEDNYIETDNAFYNFSPELAHLLQEYVENNKEDILGR